MAYHVEAIIAKTELFSGVEIDGTRAVPLKHGLSILPITKAAKVAGLGDDFCPLEDDGALPASIIQVASAVSVNGRAIYVEESMAGGPPIHQACAKFENGRLVEAPRVTDDWEPIGEGLRFLGIARGECRDEFEKVDLGRHRRPEKWLDDA